MKLLIEKRRDFKLVSHLSFIDYVKAFDNVKRDKLFEILKSKNIPILVLKCTIENYCGNKIKVNQLHWTTKFNFFLAHEGKYLIITELLTLNSNM